MSKQLGKTDQLGLGFMIFAFFLGAGNWIFPPMAGLLAGDNLAPAMVGFLITAVGLPLLGILAIAAAQGGLDRLGRYLPAGFALTIALAIYIVMVPGFGIPRTAAVSFGMAVKPYLGNDAPAWTLSLFSLLFFSCAVLIALNPHRILDRIGKVIAPLMLALVTILGVIVIFFPQGPIGPSTPEWQEAAFIKGFLKGYGTMDLLAAFLFGVLFIHTLKDKGVHHKKHQHAALLRAGAIAVSGLAAVYIILFFIGATSHQVAAGAKDGIEILASYMDASMGSAGRSIVAAVITLACLTTAVGGLSSFTEYLEDRWPKTFKYRPTLIGLALFCCIMANIELGRLVELFVPVLFAMYPVATALMVLNLLADRLPNPKATFTASISAALLFGVLDAMQFLHSELSVHSLNLAEYFGWLPLFEYNMGWLVPTTIVAGLSLLIGKNTGRAVSDAA